MQNCSTTALFDAEVYAGMAVGACKARSASRPRHEQINELDFNASTEDCKKKDVEPLTADLLVAFVVGLH